MKSLAAISTVLVPLLLAAPAAGALPEKDPLEAGGTTIQLPAPLADEIDDRDVRVEAAGGAEASGRKLAFPITGGKVLSGQAQGKIVHGGSITLRGDDGKIKLRRPRMALGKHPKMVGQLAGKRTTLFELNLGKATIKRFGFSTTYRGIHVSFSKELASAFRDRLGVPARARARFGEANVLAIPLRVALEATGATTLTYSEQFADARKAAGVQVSTLAPGTGTGNGPELPIAGGYLFPTTLTGAIGSQGGIRMEKGPTVLDLLNPVASFDDFPDLTFTAGSAPFTLGALVLGKMKVTVDGLNVRLDGITLRLTKPSATALNDAFGTSAFKTKMPVGELAIDADVR